MTVTIQLQYRTPTSRWLRKSSAPTFGPGEIALAGLRQPGFGVVGGEIDFTG